MTERIQIHLKAKFGLFSRMNKQRGKINIENVSSHVVLKNSVCDFSYVVSIFQYPS